MKHILSLALAVLLIACTKGSGPSDEANPDPKRNGTPEILPEFLTPIDTDTNETSSNSNLNEAELQKLKQNTEQHNEFLKQTPSIRLEAPAEAPKPQSYFWSKIIPPAYAQEAEAALPEIGGIIRCKNGNTVTMGQVVNHGMSLNFDPNMKIYLHIPGPAASSILMESVYRDDVVTAYPDSDNYTAEKLSIGPYTIRGYYFPLNGPISFNELYRMLHLNRESPPRENLRQEKRVDAHEGLLATDIPLNGNYDLRTTQEPGHYMITLSDEAGQLLQGTIFTVATPPGESEGLQNPHLYLEKEVVGEETFVKVMLNRNGYPTSNEIVRGVLVAFMDLRPEEIEATSPVETMGITIESLEPTAGLYRITASALSTPETPIVELGRVKVRRDPTAHITKSINIQRAELYTRVLVTATAAPSETHLTLTWSQMGIVFDAVP